MNRTYRPFINEIGTTSEGSIIRREREIITYEHRLEQWNRNLVRVALNTLGALMVDATPGQGGINKFVETFVNLTYSKTHNALGEILIHELDRDVIQQSRPFHYIQKMREVRPVPQERVEMIDGKLRAMVEMDTNTQDHTKTR